MKRWYIIPIIITITAVGLVIFLANSDRPKPVTNSKHPAVSHYFVIKEWGTRFKLPDEYKDNLIYAMKANIDVSGSGSPVINGDAAYIISNSLMKATDSTCVVDATSGKYEGRVIITRSKDRRQPPGEFDIFLAPYWFSAAKTGGGTCSPNSDGSAESSFVSQILASFKGLEAVR